MRRSLTFVAAFMLMSCGPQRDGDDVHESPASGAAQLLKPGKWVMTTTIGKIELSDLPPELAELGNTPDETDTFEFCMSPQMASNPRGPLFAGVKGGDCAYDRFLMRSGKIEAKATCKSGQAVQAIAMKGEYAPEHYQLRQTLEQDGGAYVGKMKANVTIEAKRLGECS